jgi:hypothetical protein
LGCRNGWLRWLCNSLIDYGLRRLNITDNRCRRRPAAVEKLCRQLSELRIQVLDGRQGLRLRGRLLGQKSIDRRGQLGGFRITLQRRSDTGHRPQPAFDPLRALGDILQQRIDISLQVPLGGILRQGIVGARRCHNSL